MLNSHKKFNLKYFINLYECDSVNMMSVSVGSICVYLVGNTS